jgi:hypothetical protein
MVFSCILLIGFEAATRFGVRFATRRAFVLAFLVTLFFDAVFAFVFLLTMPFSFCETAK